MATRTEADITLGLNACMICLKAEPGDALRAVGFQLRQLGSLLAEGRIEPAQAAEVLQIGEEVAESFRAIARTIELFFRGDYGRTHCAVLAAGRVVEFEKIPEPTDDLAFYKRLEAKGVEPWFPEGDLREGILLDVARETGWVMGVLEPAPSSGHTSHYQFTHCAGLAYGLPYFEVNTIAGHFLAGKEKDGGTWVLVR